MNINDMLSNDAFLVNFDGTSKKQVLEELSKLAEIKLGINSRLLLENLAKREKLGSTAVGNGIAIPHANVTDIDKPYVYNSIWLNLYSIFFLNDKNFNFLTLPSFLLFLSFVLFLV